jgi:hypothetical protein
MRETASPSSVLAVTHALQKLALGLLQRDGLWVLAGVGIACTSLVVAAGALLALARAAALFLSHAAG